jgi:glycosyltransferase involved in cell wall biosynthesis
MPKKTTPRVVFVNRYFYPDLCATSQLLSDLAHRLAKEGFNVHVVCSRQLYDDAKAPLPEREVVNGIQVHRVWTTRFGRSELIGRSIDYLTFGGLAALKLLRLVRRDDIIIAKTDPPLLSIVTACVATLKAAQPINWLQDIFPEIATHLGSNPLPKWLDRIVRGMRTRSLMAARANIVLGERMRTHLLQLRVPPDQIRVIENWADGSAIVPMSAQSTALRQSLETAVRFVVGYSGISDAHMNMEPSTPPSHCAKNPTFFL